MKTSGTSKLMRTVCTALVLLVIITSGVSAVYWLAGGELKRGSDFAVYVMVLVYLWALVGKIAIAKHRESNVE